MARIPCDEHRDDVTALLAGRFREQLRDLDHTLRGHVLAQDVRARINVPAWSNSQMDGFAVRTADLSATGRTRLPVSDPIPAGAAPGELPGGSARPIMTGAPLPHGADAVVPIEETAERSFDLAAVTLEPADASPGRFVRATGSDTSAGDVIARRGDVLTPARIGHMISCGIAQVAVRERLRVLVISTGSEVTAPGQPLPDGGVYDANGPAVAGALEEAGADVVDVLRVGDAPGALSAAIRAALRTATQGREPIDLVVSSGGVSAGAYEPVRQAAADPGVQLVFPKVAIQPGGPQGIGTIDGVAWVALPGNPVSALLSVELFLRPALGAAPRLTMRAPLRLEADEPSPGHLEQYRRAWLLPSGEARLAGGPSSHLLGALAQANALVRIPVGVERLRDGDTVDVILLQ